jgi:hypothetical protein
MRAQRHDAASIGFVHQPHSGWSDRIAGSHRPPSRRTRAADDGSDEKMIFSSAGSNCSMRVGSWARASPDITKPPCCYGIQREPLRDAILSVLGAAFRIIWPPAKGEDFKPLLGAHRRGGAATPVGQARARPCGDRSPHQTGSAIALQHPAAHEPSKVKPMDTRRLGMSERP